MVPGRERASSEYTASARTHNRRRRELMSVLASIGLDDWHRCRRRIPADGFPPRNPQPCALRVDAARSRPAACDFAANRYQTTGMARRTFASLLVVVAVIAAMWWLQRESAIAPQPTADPNATSAAKLLTSEVPATGDAAVVDVASKRIAEPGEAVLVGRVVDAKGVPVVAAAVHLAEDAPWSPRELLLRLQRGAFVGAFASALSGSDGGYRLLVPMDAIARTLQVQALPMHHGDAAMRHLRITSTITRLPDLVVPSERPVKVTVIDDASEAPIAGAVVSVHPVAVSLLRLPGRENGRTAVTDIAGVCEVAGVPVGSFTFRAAAPGHATGELLSQAVLADQPTDLLLALPAGRVVTGHVVDQAGQTVAGAAVDAKPLLEGAWARATANTDLAGRFEVVGVGHGDWRITVGKVGYRTLAREPLTNGADRLVLTLVAQGAVRLVVVDANGASRVPYDVAARPAGPAGGLRALPPRRVVATDLREGAFVLDDLDPGEWTLQVRAPGAAVATSEPVKVDEGAIADMRMVLTAGASLRLRLMTHDGRPLANARVTTQPDGFLDGPVADVMSPLQGLPLGVSPAKAIAAGAVTLTNLAAGRYQLRIEANGRAPFYVRGVVVTDVDVDLGLVTLPAAVRLFGTALVGDAADATIVVQVLALAGGNLPAGYRVEANVDREGKWELALQLPAGGYAVMAGRRRADDPFLENQDHASSRTEVELANEPDRNVALRLPPR